MRYGLIPDKYKDLLILHRKLIDGLHYDLVDNNIALGEMTANVLALIASDFTCERCGNKDELTIHHLIQRKVRGICDDKKYIPQRHYFENQVVLCTDCHSKVDRVSKDGLIPLNNELLKGYKELEIENKPIKAIMDVKKKNKKNVKK